MPIRAQRRSVGLPCARTCFLTTSAMLTQTKGNACTKLVVPSSGSHLQGAHDLVRLKAMRSGV